MRHQKPTLVLTMAVIMVALVSMTLPRNATSVSVLTGLWATFVSILSVIFTRRVLMSARITDCVCTSMVQVSASVNQDGAGLTVPLISMSAHSSRVRMEALV